MRLEQGQAVGGPVTRLAKLTAALRAHLGHLAPDAQDAVLQQVVTQVKGAWGIPTGADRAHQAEPSAHHPEPHGSAQLNAGP